MRLGIDYGTTRTVVAVADRGNYPVVSFHTADGDTQDWYPSLITARGDVRLYGLDAACHQDDPDWSLLRSCKRQLSALGPTARITLGTGAVPALDLLTAFLAQLRRDLVERSNLCVTPARDPGGRDCRACKRQQQSALPNAGGLPPRRLSRPRAAQ